MVARLIVALFMLLPQVGFAWDNPFTTGADDYSLNGFLDRVMFQFTQENPEADRNVLVAQVKELEDVLQQKLKVMQQEYSELTPLERRIAYRDLDFEIQQVIFGWHELGSDPLTDEESQALLTKILQLMLVQALIQPSEEARDKIWGLGTGLTGLILLMAFPDGSAAHITGDVLGLYGLGYFNLAYMTDKPWVQRLMKYLRKTRGQIPYFTNLAYRMVRNEEVHSQLGALADFNTERTRFPGSRVGMWSQNQAAEYLEGELEIREREAWSIPANYYLEYLRRMSDKTLSENLKNLNCEALLVI